MLDSPITNTALPGIAAALASVLARSLPAPVAASALQGLSAV